VITFRLPRPPSVNNLFFTTKRGSRARTDRYQRWRNEAHQLIMVQRVGQPWPLVGRYTLSLVIERGRGDLGNCEKAVSDALVYMGIVADDSLAEEIHLRWGAVEGCAVEIEAWRAGDVLERQESVDAGA